MDMVANIRKHPVNSQTFARIIKEGYVYEDKTDLMWQIAHLALLVFLSRPHRFIKTLLTTLQENYCRNERNLFEGLKIVN